MAAVDNVNDAPTGGVTISGIVAEDQTLTADTSTLADADGLGTLHYQWQRDTGSGFVNVGADQATYTLGDADVGAEVRVVVSYTDGQGTAESVTSGGLGPVDNVNDAPTGGVSVTGTPVQNQVLTADTSTLADADGLGSLSYQWQLNGASVAGATQSTYTATSPGQVSVIVTYVDGHGTTESVTSPAVTVSSSNAPPVAVPVILTPAVEDMSYTVTKAQLLAGVSDDNPSSLSITSVSIQSGGGTLHDNGNGTWTYTPAPNDDTSVAFSYTASDGQYTTSSTAVLDITPVNDAPVATITPASYSATEQVALTLKGTGLSISDVDAGSGPMTVVLSVGEGTLSATAGNSGVGISGNNSSSLTITGTQTQINNFLGAASTSTLSYVDNTNTPSASTSLTMTVKDNGNTGTGGNLTGSDSAAINITRVNDAPVATITPTSYSATEQVALTLKGSGLAISDVDAGSGPMTVVLSVGEGTLSATAGNSGVGISGNNSSSLTITGTQTQINNFLGAASTSTLSYVDNTNTPSASTTLTMTVKDNGNVGTGGNLTGTDTATITIAPVNDKPVITSDGGGSTAREYVCENTKFVTRVTATDAETNNLVYSIVGGADAAKFTIDATTGALAFIAAPDYEHPTDAGANNVYDVVVQVSDGNGGTDTQAIAVAVTNNNPEIVSGDGGANSFLASGDWEAFFGFGGSDTVSYATARSGVTANLANILANKGEALGDSYFSIENLTGSAFNDKLTGDSGANVLEGGKGGDQLDGAGGSDTASYEHATAGIIADLTKSSNNTGEAQGDTYSSIENLLGSSFNDRLVGDSSNNVLTGGSGVDTLIGNNGDDKLIGGPGADTLNGGAGKDLFVYLKPSDGGDLIQGFVVKDDQIQISASGFGGGLVAGQHLVAGSTFISNLNPVAPTTAATFLYDTDAHDLYFDDDGSGAHAAVKIAHFDTAVALKADDFDFVA